MRKTYLLGILFFMFLWFFGSILVNSEFILPSPLIVGRIFLSFFKDEIILKSVISTILKGLLATVLTVFLGTTFGFIMGLNQKVFDFLRPLVNVLQTVPVISWLAFVIFLWGIGWRGPVLITVVSLIPNAIFSVAYGVQNIDKKLLEVAFIYKVPKRKVFYDIYIGGIVPFLLSALEVVSGNIWKVIIVSEYMCGDTGIGVQIAWARQYVDVPKVYALTIFAVILGLFSEKLIKRFIKKILLAYEVEYQ